METTSVRSRHRLLLINVLALLIVLAALGASPAPAFADPGNCDGCVARLFVQESSGPNRKRSQGGSSARTRRT